MSELVLHPEQGYGDSLELLLGSDDLDGLVGYTSANDWITFADGTSSSTGATVTGLTNGTAYEFRVIAVNGIGQSDPSNTAGPYTPESGVTGSGSPTLAALTSAGTGTHTSNITGTGTPTLDAVTSSGSGTTGATPSGSGTPSLASVTSSGRGFVSIGNFPVAVASGGRYLEDQNGNPWFGSGDTAWSAIVQLSNADITTYVEAIAAKGVNVVLVNAIDSAYGTNAPNNIDNVAPFTGTAFQSDLNATYWARFDHFIGECVRLGVTALVCPQYFGFSSDGWKTELAAASNAQCLAYGQAVGQRVRGVRGIMWAAGGDANPDATTIVRQRNIVDGIDDHHPGLWCGHTAPTGSDTAAWSSDHYDAEAWLDFEFGYHQGTTIVPEGESHYAGMSTVRPMLYVAEGGYYDDDFGTTDRKDQRRDIYGGPLSGGLAGFLYGDAPRWHFDGYFDGSTGTWEDSLLRDATADLERAATDIYANLQTDTLRPDTTSTFVTGGKSSGATEAAALFDTVHAVIYTQTTGTITLDLTELSGITAVRIRRYDPTNGAFTTVTSSEPTSNSAYGITHPGNNADGVADWVYLLDYATPSGSGTPSLSSFTSSGVGTFGSAPSGSGTPTLDAATSSGTGTHTANITGSGTPSLAALTAAGTGALTATGTGTPALDALTAAGTGTLTQTGSGTPALASSTSSGVGTHGTDTNGIGSPTLADVTSTGAGAHTALITGTGTATLAALTSTGTGVHTITGTGAPVLVSFTSAGVGNMAPSGSGTPVLAAVTSTGEGFHGAAATITGRLLTRRADVARTTRRSDAPRATDRHDTPRTTRRTGH